MLLDLVQVLKGIKNVVLKNGVELVLNACHKSCHLQGVDALEVECLTPLKSLEIVELELVKNIQNSYDDFGLIHALPGHFEVFFGEHVIRSIGLVENSLSLKSEKC